MNQSEQNGTDPRRFSLRTLAALALAVAPLIPSAVASERMLESFHDDIEPLLDQYCYDCHGYGSDKGGVVLDEFSADSVRDRDLWMRVLKNTRSHIMPPPDEAGASEEDREFFLPSDNERAQLIDWIKTGPFEIDPKQPDPGKLTVQRLNRIEYQNTVFDLMGVEFDALDAFPTDNSGEGFDNIGELLTLSPMMLEKYLDAASSIVDTAVPTQPLVLPERRFAEEELVDLFSPAPEGEDASRDDLQMSFYTPSTRSAVFDIEKAGKYRVVLDLKPVSFSSFQGFDYNRCRLVFKIDGETKIDREFEFVSGRTFEYSFDYEWEPGERTFSFEVEPLTSGLDKIKKLKMKVEHITLLGPYGPENRTRPPNYDRFFPGEVPEDEIMRVEYTKNRLREFATRAFRRPVDEDTVDRLAHLAKSISSQEGFNYEMGVAQAMVAILASPRFLFREEESQPGTECDAHPLIDEYSLASRLSYFLWSTMPDEELFRLAEASELRANLDQQIRRMMEDKRSKSFMRNFAGQWLHARDIEGVNISSLDVWLRDHPDPELAVAKKEYQIVREIPESSRTPEQQETYRRTREIVVKAYKKDRPELKSKLLRAMRQETEMYFEHVFREDRSLTELIDSDYTFLNDDLAEHYGIEGITGSEMRKVALEPNSPRGGILTQGTILAFTSNPTRTSPVKRGVFILENILGTPPAAPPPNIPSLEDISDDAIDAMSLRETLALHREDALCSSCHNRMDPLGLALENFNAMGMWRDSELNQPIESDGQLITGERFDNVQEMKRILATERISDFYYCLSEKLLTYALGRGLEYYDTETVDQLVATLQNTNGSPSALIEAVIYSTPFQKHRNANLLPN